MCGYGDVGKVCVFAFRGSGDHVFVAECEPFCALGVQVAAMSEVIMCQPARSDTGQTIAR